MRTADQRARAWAKLLAEAEKSPVTIFYRGIDEHSKPLYEIKRLQMVRDRSPVLCAPLAEHQVMQALEGHDEPTNP